MMLTARQQQILDAIHIRVDIGQPCPTQQELGLELGITQQTVAAHLAALKRKGVIECDPAAHRAIRVAVKRQSNAI